MDAENYIFAYSLPSHLMDILEINHVIHAHKFLDMHMLISSWMVGDKLYIILCVGCVRKVTDFESYMRHSCSKQVVGNRCGVQVA